MQRQFNTKEIVRCENFQQSTRREKSVSEYMKISLMYREFENENTKVTY